MYLIATYPIPIALATFLMESNVVGSISSEETTNPLLLYKGFKLVTG